MEEKLAAAAERAEGLTGAIDHLVDLMQKEPGAVAALAALTFSFIVALKILKKALATLEAVALAAATLWFFTAPDRQHAIESAREDARKLGTELRERAQDEGRKALQMRDSR